MGVLTHVAGDAANNVGVIIAGAIIWKTTSPTRYYADPAISMAIAFMIFASSLPLVRKSGLILLESAPVGTNPHDIQHDIEQLDGVQAVHELHVWRLNQQKTLATAHVTVAEGTYAAFPVLAKTITQCFHAYGIHAVTLQPEEGSRVVISSDEGSGGAGISNEDGRQGNPGTDGVCAARCDADGCPQPGCCE